MITDGVKVLENEISHEIYWDILDHYDQGGNFQDLLQKHPIDSNLTDPLDVENYAVGYALACWEIGWLDTKLLQHTQSILTEAASVKYWNESFSEVMGRARKKEIQKLSQQLASPNPKIRKPKKYKSVGKYLFQLHEVISFQLPNKNYAAAIVLNITELRGVCTYHLGKIVYNRDTPPNLEEIENASIVGDQGSSKGGLLALSLFTPDEDAPFGLYMVTIDHKKFSKFSDQFQVIGKLSLGEDTKSASSTSTSNTIDDLKLKFNTPEAFYKVSRNKIYPIKVLLA